MKCFLHRCHGVKLSAKKEVLERHHEVHKYEQDCLAQLTRGAPHIDIKVWEIYIRLLGDLNDVAAFNILGPSD